MTEEPKAVGEVVTSEVTKHDAAPAKKGHPKSRMHKDLPKPEPKVEAAPAPAKPKFVMSDTPFEPEAPKVKVSARTLAEQKRGRESIARR